MARGLSDAAFRGRRNRFLAKVKAAAENAGLATELDRKLGQVMVSDGGKRFAIYMRHGHMSNGESVIERRVAIRAPGLAERNFGSFTWMPYDAPARAFWAGIDKGKFEPAEMLAAMKEG